MDYPSSRLEFLENSKPASSRSFFEKFLPFLKNFWIDTDDDTIYRTTAERRHISFRLPISNDEYCTVYSDGKIDLQPLFRRLESKDADRICSELIDILPNPKSVKDFKTYKINYFPFRELDDSGCDRFIKVVRLISTTLSYPPDRRAQNSDQGDVIADLEKIRQSEPNETERERLTKARIGQGQFRADVAARWKSGETCVLTGVSIPEMLTASHIKPWRYSNNKERLDPMNGLLLVAHADRLFDQFLLSFEERKNGYASVLHPRVRADAAKLGLNAGMRLDTSHLGKDDLARFKRYIDDHLKCHLELVMQV